MKLGLGEKITESNQVEHRFSPHEIDQFYQQHIPVNKCTIKQQNFYEKKFLFDIENQCHKLPIISPGLYNFIMGFRRPYIWGAIREGLQPD